MSRWLAAALVAVALVAATVVPAYAQIYGDDLTREQKIAVLKKGKPANVSDLDWEGMQIRFFADLREERAGSVPAIPVLRAALNGPSQHVAVTAAGTLLVIDPVASRSVAFAALARGVKNDDDDQVQQWALNELGALGVFNRLPPEAESILTEFLRGRSQHRDKAARALADVPPARIPATVSLLIPVLDDRDRGLRIVTAETLGRFGRAAMAAAGPLRAKLTSQDPMERIYVATALAQIEDPLSPNVVPVLVAELSSKFDTDRIYAVRGLAAAGPAAKSAVPALQKLRETAEGTLRDDIDVALERMGVAPPPRPPAPAPAPARRNADAAATLQTAVDQLRSPDVETRRRALRFLDDRGFEARASFAAISQALKDSEISIRYLAAFVLTSIDASRAAIAIPMLSEMLRSDVPIPATTARTLGWGGLARLGRAGTDVLIAALKDPSAETRAAGALGLGYADVYPPAAVTALIAAIKDPEEIVRVEVIRTLQARPQAGNPMTAVFSAALSDPSATVRSFAAWGLADGGPANRDALPLLRKAASDADAGVKIAAATAIVSIDRAGARDLLPMLIAEFAAARAAGASDGGAEFRMIVASQGLGRFGPAAAGALPALERAFAADTGLAQGYAGVAIALIDVGRRPLVIDRFIEMLSKPETYVTADILARLKELGPLAAAAIPVVESYRTHTDSIMRRTANEALAAMRTVPESPMLAAPVPTPAVNPCEYTTARPLAPYFCRVDNHLKAYSPDRRGQADNDRWLDLAVSELDTALSLGRGTPDHAVVLQRQIDLQAPPYRNDLTKAVDLLTQLAALQGPTGKAKIELEAVREVLGLASSAYFDPDDQRLYVSLRAKWRPRLTSPTVSAPSYVLQAPKPLPPADLPAIIKKVAPVYPALSQRAGIQGVVQVEILINEAGKVASAKILKSIPMLDQAALDAVKQWEFAPPMVNGRPATKVAAVDVEFYLQKQ